MKELDHIDADDALGYAQRLATALWEKYGKERAPNWKPLDTVLWVLTQIDNMTAGMVRKDEQPANLRQALDRAAYALFQIKRMVPEEIPKFAADEHSAACAVLDGEQPLKRSE